MWDKPAGPLQENPELWSPAKLNGLSQDAAGAIADALLASYRPLVLTSYLGRHPKAFAALIELSERVGVGVSEIVPAYTNFPGDHENHLGHRLNAHVADADLILLLDIDVPWLPLDAKPAPGARVFHIDSDPLKLNLLYWHYPVEASYMADSGVALSEILDCLDEPVTGRDARKAWIPSVRPKEVTHGMKLPEIAAAHPANPVDRPAIFSDHPEMWGPVCSWNFETGAHALRLVFSGVFERYPKAKLILGHMGETLPATLWRFDSRWPISHRGAVTLNEPPSFYIRRNIAITTSGMCADAALRCAIDAMGLKQVMFSVDYPMEKTDVAAKIMVDATLTPTERLAIAHGHAEGLLDLSPLDSQ